MTEFTQLGLDPTILSAVAAAGYETPTLIQSQSIPPALQGRDVLGIAQTGTGKTAAFVLPMIHTLNQGRPKARMPRSLVLAPTRELAMQVADNFMTYSANSKLAMALLIGGVSFADQFARIDKGVDVLIATPGRLLDHFERGRLLLSGVQIVTVDEADRMLDMGFIPDVERIFRLTPFTRQTLFFSATMAPEIERLTNEFLSNPTRIEVTRRASVGKNIFQSAVMVKKSRNRELEFKNKRALLRREIQARGQEITNGIIFCNRKADVDILLRSMRAHRIDCAAIHGDLDQAVRTCVLDEFREGKKRFLVASDVAARGLDIPNVSHVFNFDVPVNPEDYIHRVGRTGRAGREGTAITLVTPSEIRSLRAIENLVERRLERIGAGLKDTSVATKPPAGDLQGAPPDAANGQQNGQVKMSSKEPAVPTNNRTQSKPKQTRHPNVEVVGMGDHVPAFLKRDITDALSA